MKIKKLFIILTIILIYTIFKPINIYAISKTTSYLAIDNVEDLSINDLVFQNINFNNCSDNTGEKICIKSDLINNNKEINFGMIINLYDINNNIIERFSKEFTALTGVSEFLYKNELKNISINDIKYYEIEVTINDNITEQTNIYRDYVIKKYNVNIKVNENNTFDIEEIIIANFNEPRHGIYRILPITSQIYRKDGTYESKYSQITNINVNNNFKIEQGNEAYKILIGSENKTVIGEEEYIIKYKHNLGKDHIKEYDEIYYNIIGTEWNTEIENVSFKINMPKDFDKSKINFTTGKNGSVENNVVYNIDGNTITGYYNGKLNPYEGITIRCELPENYFVGEAFEMNKYAFLIFLLPLTFLLISFIFWIKYGKDRKIVETVEFYPPNNLNSLEIGFLYKGKALNKDVISLLIYLANKGYIEIERLNENDNFIIKKIKEYDGNNKYEKIFFNGLFKNNVETTTIHKLKNKFYRTVDTITTEINIEKNTKKILKSNSFIKFIIILMQILITLSIIIIPSMDYITKYEIIVQTIMLLFILSFYSICFINDIPISFKIVWITMISLISILVLSFMPFMMAIIDNKFYLIGFLISVISKIIMYKINSLMSKRTDYGIEMLGKIEGFKNYLITVEKDELEKLVEKDPKYFYSILPYTYVLNISNKWIDKFKSIAISPPDWYISSSNFDSISFGNSIKSTMHSAEKCMSSSPSASSGSSFGSSSGGGHSGGGSGGGGGGSW